MTKPKLLGHKHSIVNTAFDKQRRAAKDRDIEFLLTLDEWCGIWGASGKFEERGRGSGRYCMARKGDKGPYAIGNLEITTNRENGALAGYAGRGRPSKRKGRSFGSNRLSLEQVILAKKLRSRGVSINKIAKALGVAWDTIRLCLETQSSLTAP